MSETARVDEKERQLRVSALLHSVEDSIKKNELEAALDTIRKVYQYDLKNMYARAFEERILVMMMQRGEKELKVKYDQQRTKLKEEVDRNAQIEINRRLKEYHRQWEEETARREAKERQEKQLEEKARKASIEEQKAEGVRDYAALVDVNRGKIEQWEQKMRLEIKAAVENERLRIERELEERLAAMPVAAAKPAAKAPVPVSPKRTPVPVVKQIKTEIEHRVARNFDQAKQQMEMTIADRTESAHTMMQQEAVEKMRAEFAAIQAEMQRQFEIDKQNLIEREQAKTKERLVEAYKTFIVLMDESIPKDLLNTYLQSLRSILGISDEEHAQILRSVQVNSYIDTLKASWEKGSITPEERDMLSHLCGLYQISQEEHDRLTKQVKKQLGLPDENAMLLVIDDSTDLLAFIDYVMKKTYANIRTAASVKKALELIGQEMPAMILCDVMMPQIGGFAFYDQIQKGEYGEALKKVPFVFMSGCSDEYMKKIAEGLGVNKYLTKPFTVETLEKTVKEMLNPDRSA